MKVQVVFFVQSIFPSSFTLWSNFFIREVPDSTLRFNSLFGIGWIGLSYILCLIVFFLCLMLTCTESIYLQSFHFTSKYISTLFKAAHYRLMSKTIWFQCIIHRLLDSLVEECWLRVQEVPGSIPSQGPRHIKDVIKMVAVVSLFSTQHWKGKYWLFLKNKDKKIMDKIWYRNPSKSEVIGCCGGYIKTEWPRRTDNSLTLKK